MSKTITGVVSSIAADKTIVITVHTRKTHPLYKKQYTVTSKYMAHDEENTCQIGDQVSIVETRPLSARKRHVLKEVLKRTAIAKEDRDVIDKVSDVSEKKEEETK